MVFVPLRSLLPYGKRVITSPAAVHRRLSRCIEKDDDASGYGMALYAMQWAPCTGIIWLVHTHRSRASWQEEERPDVSLSPRMAPFSKHERADNRNLSKFRHSGT